jgi:hypothetical protein
MKAIELLGKNGELTHKLRTSSDLIRHIGTRAEGTSNYSLFLGAGASVTSDIRSASELITIWLKELFDIYNDREPTSIDEAKEYFEKSHASWYNPSNPYSSLFEKRYDLASQRRRFVEQEVENKLPSIGYAYLTSLVDANYFNSIFTTNFDDLINEAFYQFSNKRPIQCAHDSAIHSISLTSKRSKIIKIHGDYLFDDIKSTLRETESLEQNTKDKLVEFCKEYGLVVMGYAGNDRSVMDVFEYLSKQDNYLKNGIYWCLRKDDEVSHSLRNLLWKDKVYPVLIDGFDQFIAKAHNKLTKTNLDIESNLNHSKLQNIIKYILEDPYKLSNDGVIESELNTLKNNNSSHDITGFLTTLSSDKNPDEEHSLPDTRNILEIDTLINKKDFKLALSQSEEYYYRTSISKVKARYAMKIIDISKLMEDYGLALRWADKLLELDKYDLNSVLIKSKCIENNIKRYDYLDDVLSDFTHEFRIINAISKVAVDIMKCTGECDRSKVEDVFGKLDLSLKLDPSLDNSAWDIKFSFLKYLLSLEKSDDDKKKISKKMDEMIAKVNAINPVHLTTLEMKSIKYSSSSDYGLAVKFTKELYELFDKSSVRVKKSIDRILNSIVSDLPSFNDKGDYKKEMYFYYENHYGCFDNSRDQKIKICKANYFIGQNKDLVSAREIVSDMLAFDDSVYFLKEIINVSVGLDNFDFLTVESVLEKHKYILTKVYYHETKSHVQSLLGNYDDAIFHLEKAFEKGLDLNSYLTYLSFYYLKKKDFKKVISLSEKFKNFDGEAFVINLQYAAKEVGSKLYDEICLRNLSAKSSMLGVKICAFSILGNYQRAKALMKSSIEDDYMNFHSYSQWPALNQTIVKDVQSAA